MKKEKSIGVIGCGRWGTFLAWYAANYCVETVQLYGLKDSKEFIELSETGKNSFLKLSDNMQLTTEKEEILKNDFIIISVGAQHFRGLCKELAEYDLTGKTFLLAMKGLEQESSKRLSVVMKEEIDQNINIAVLAGPGHVQEYTKGVPSCVVVDSENEDTEVKVISILSSDLMRFYHGTDLIGTEIGAALKNVIGVAAGVLDGMEWQGLKGALMARAPIEIGRFIKSMGGNPMSAYGLAHLGDYEATLFSKYSNNRAFGEKFARGEDFDKLAEGYYTLKAVRDIAIEKGIDMPITEAIYNVIYDKKDLKEEINALFSRDIRAEF